MLALIGILRSHSTIPVKRLGIPDKQKRQPREQAALVVVQICLSFERVPAGIFAGVAQLCFDAQQLVVFRDAI